MNFVHRYSAPVHAELRFEILIYDSLRAVFPMFYAWAQAHTFGHVDKLVFRNTVTDR